MTEQEALYKYCLRLGDNALILSYRLSEWCSRAPILEEDLALTNFALDMIGRARAFLSYAAEIEGRNSTEDDIAYRRGEREYTNSLMYELPNKDFAYTMARQLFISAFEYYFFSALKESKNATIAAIAAKTLKEVKYHLSHASDWTIRLGDGTDESATRMQKAINDMWMYTGELFEMDDVDDCLEQLGLAVDLAILKKDWRNRIRFVLQEAKISMPEDGYMQTGGHKGIHTEHLGHILSEMQYLQRAYPDATW